MNDLTQAIKIALRFTPSGPAPGLEGVLFEFKGRVLYIYAADGYAMVRLTLPNLGTDKNGEYFVSAADLKRITSESQVISGLIAWDGSLMLMDDSATEELRCIQCGYEDIHHKYFTPDPPPAGGADFDMDLLRDVVTRCEGVLDGNHAANIRSSGRRILIAPLIRQDVEDLVAVDIVVAGWEA